LRRLATTVLLGGLLSATLIRFAPGLGVDESQLDTRWRQETLHRMRSANDPGMDNVFLFYARFLAGYLRGDLGTSRTLERPVTELLRDRLPPTAASVACALLLAWCAGLAVALAAARFPKPLVEAGAAVSAVAIQCIPAAVLGLLLVIAGGRGFLLSTAGLALVLYSRVTPFVRNILAQAAAMPHVLAARARGAGEWRILFRHILAPALPQIIALAGVSVSLALSVAVPMETLLDVPGIGQLAWQAALGRDVYLLVNVTVVLSLAVLTANALSDWAAASAFTPRRSA
jgi:peptide/nickel transport system permease protein